MSKTYKILAINPGSTSNKIGVYENNQLIFEKTLRHSVEELEKYKTIFDQYEFRKDIILNSLKENNIEIDELDAVVGRGGLLKPIEGGTYEVNQNMIEDLKVGVLGEHASNLGGILAKEIGDMAGARSFIVDPVVVDELEEIARISGLKEIERKSIFHALNQKAVGRRFAESINKKYEDLNLIIAHLGGGVSVGCHKQGKVVDVSNALDGEGPFSPERSGSLPVGDLVKMCYSGKYSLEEMKSFIKGKGGLVSYLDTTDGIEVSNRMKAGDKKAELIYKAMAYQVSKEIGAVSTVLKGKVDGIILTGGIAYDEDFTGWIKDSVSFISDVTIYPGEDELDALAQGGLRVLRGDESAKEY